MLSPVRVRYSVCVHDSADSTIGVESDEEDFERFDEDELDELDNFDDDDDEEEGVGKGTSPTKMTARQRAKGNTDLQETLLALPQGGSNHLCSCDSIFLAEL